MKRAPLHVVNGLLAASVLYFAASLSRGDRGPVDWVVLTAIVGTLLYNLVSAGRRLYRAGGLRDVWHLLRTVLFWALAASALLLQPDPAGGWRPVAGWFLAAVAALDTFALARKERRAVEAQRVAA